MTCLVHLKLAGGLVEVARAMRMFRRYRLSRSRVSLGREGSVEVATLSAILADARRSRVVAAALCRLPGVLEAVVSSDV